MIQALKGRVSKRQEAFWGGGGKRFVQVGNKISFVISFFFVLLFHFRVSQSLSFHKEKRFVSIDKSLGGWKYRLFVGRQTDRQAGGKEERKEGGYSLSSLWYIILFRPPFGSLLLFFSFLLWLSSTPPCITSKPRDKEGSACRIKSERRYIGKPITLMDWELPLRCFENTTEAKSFSGSAKTWRSYGKFIHLFKTAIQALLYR